MSYPDDDYHETREESMKEIESSKATGAICTCQRVEYDPIKHEDGSFTWKRWRCSECGAEFKRARFVNSPEWDIKRQEHEDTAPHPDCSCRVCCLIFENRQLTAKFDAERLLRERDTLKVAEACGIDLEAGGNGLTPETREAVLECIKQGAKKSSRLTSTLRVLNEHGLLARGMLPEQIARVLGAQRQYRPHILVKPRSGEDLVSWLESRIRDAMQTSLEAGLSKEEAAKVALSISRSYVPLWAGPELLLGFEK